MANGPSRDDFAIRATFEDEATEGMRQLSNEAEKAGQKIEGSAAKVRGFRDWIREGKQVIGTVRDIGAAFGLVFGVGFSFQALLGLFRDLIEESRRYSQQIEALRFQTVIFGENTEATSAEAKKLAASLDDLYDATESTTLQLFTAGRTMGLTNEQTSRAIALSTVLAKQMGIDTKDAFGAVAQAVLGTRAGMESLGKLMGARIDDSESLRKALDNLGRSLTVTSLLDQATDVDAANRTWGSRLGGVPAITDLDDLNRRIRTMGGTATHGGRQMIFLRDQIVALQGATEPLRRAMSPLEEEQLKTAEASLTLSRALREFVASAIPGDTASKLAAIRTEVDRQILSISEGVDPIAAKLEKIDATGARETAQALRELGEQAKDTARAIGQAKIDEEIQRQEDAIQNAADERNRLLKQQQDAMEAYKEALRGDIRTIEGVSFAAANAIGGQFEDAFMSIVTGSKSAKEAFADMARGILADLARIAIQSAISSVIGGIFGIPLPTLARREGGIQGGPHAFGGEPLSLSRFEQSYGSAPMRRFAVGGGVMVHPTRVPGGIAGEDGAEAFVKLRHGKIPVELAGDRGGGQNVTVQVNVTSLDPRTAYELLAQDPVRLGQAMAAAFQSSNVLRQAAAQVR